MVDTKKQNSDQCRSVDNDHTFDTIPKVVCCLEDDATHLLQHRLVSCWPHPQAFQQSERLATSGQQPLWRWRRLA